VLAVFVVVAVVAFFERGVTAAVTTFRWDGAVGCTRVFVFHVEVDVNPVVTLLRAVLDAVAAACSGLTQRRATVVRRTVVGAVATQLETGCDHASTPRRTGETTRLTATVTAASQARLALVAALYDVVAAIGFQLAGRSAADVFGVFI